MPLWSDFGLAVTLLVAGAGATVAFAASGGKHRRGNSFAGELAIELGWSLLASLLLGAGGVAFIAWGGALPI